MSKKRGQKREGKGGRKKILLLKSKQGKPFSDREEDTCCNLSSKEKFNMHKSLYDINPIQVSTYRLHVREAERARGSETPV